MTNAAHTPGPWSYNRDVGGMHGHVISTGDYIICESPDAGDGASPDTEANARLISAAPELLEVLKRSAQRMRQLCDMVNTYRNMLGLGNKVKLEHFDDIACAAIAKAKGGAI